jgi:hypothetical protein
MIHTINDFNFYGNNSINTDEVIKALEMSKVLHLNNFSFELTAAEAKTFLTPTILDQNAKNISYNPNTQALKGTKVQNSDEEKLLQMMKRFFEYSQNLITTLIPDYKDKLEIGKTSFRPIEIEGRKTSATKDDTRLHIDAFPSMPNQGKRILRVFCNVNPEGKTRLWHLGEPFEDVLSKFADSVYKPLPGLRKLLNRIGITKSYRTLYDHYMLILHDNMKLNELYQQTVAKQEFHFPAKSTWVVFTDSVSHAALKGQYLLEQTFYLPPDLMQNPQLSPLHVLEQHFGETLRG